MFFFFFLQFDMLCRCSFKMRKEKSKSRSRFWFVNSPETQYGWGDSSLVSSVGRLTLCGGGSVCHFGLDEYGGCLSLTLTLSLSLSFSVYLSLSFCSHLVTAPIDLVKMTKWGNNMSRRPACSSVPSLLLHASSAPLPTAVGHGA